MSVRRMSSCGFGLGLYLVLAPAVAGHFRPIEVQKAPVERLVANLEEDDQEGSEER